MITQLIVTFLGWLAMLWLSINLIGMLLRGLVSNPEIDQLATEGSDFIKKIAKEHQEAEKKVNFVALALIIVYLVALYYFWNVWIVVAALMIMAARIPDLLWEMQHGRANVKKMPAIYHLTLLVMLAALPVLWYGLYASS